MADDDPITDRIIRTPKATVTIHGDLSEVDFVYRACNRALLESGRYTIPAPGNDPWTDYAQPEPIHTPDFLRRRCAELERQLAESESRELIQDLRSRLNVETLRANAWQMAFTDQTEMVNEAIGSLTDDPEPNLYNHVARSILSAE